MSDVQTPPPPPDEQVDVQRAAAIGAVVIAVFVIGLIVLAAVLALNAGVTAPGVEVLRNLMIIIMALEMIIIGTALTVLLIQVARFVNLLSTEVNPILQSAADTVNTVKGTTQFLSKHLVEPVVTLNSAVSGLGKVAGDVDAIRKMIETAATIASAATPTSATSQPASAPHPPASAAEAGHPAAPATEEKPRRAPRKRKKTTPEVEDQPNE